MSVSIKWKGGNLLGLDILHTDVPLLKFPKSRHLHHKDVAPFSAQQKQLT